jgi:hypothetical protein
MSNYEKLENSDELKKSISKIQKILINNKFYNKKFTCNQLSSLLDDIVYDYNELNSKTCSLHEFKSLSNLKNLNSHLTIDSKKHLFNNYLKKQVKNITYNEDINNEIDNIVNLFFNEYLYKCT